MSTADVSLTTAGTFGSINGAVFATDKVKAGTGIFDSFLQVQHNGTEQGYNTDVGRPMDDGSSARHNHSILLADVPLVFGDGSNGTQEGVTYREFLLDSNEVSGGTNNLISLDRLQIWQEESGSLTNFTPGSGFAGSHTNYLAYNLDAGGDHWVAINSGLSSGSGRSDVRVLIPDSYFINDAAHRYVTLYSQFGVQGGGYASSGGFEEWGLSNASGGAKSALVVTKTAAVDGGTADTAGEVITYTIKVGNVGNTALTGLTVTDPSVSNLHGVDANLDGFNDGDTNHDGQLSAGETWSYTASRTVTQADLDTNGNGLGLISNTVTADTNETNPVSASAAVVVERHNQVVLDKSADVTSVDQAGDVINYTITVTNTGNITQSGLNVTDSQVNIVTPIYDFSAPILGPELLGPVLNGDYNVGDTNQNGVQDPGETFVYANPGDLNQNGIQDPGEVFEYTNVGDTNQNGFQDTGETFQYYNAGDTNHNGVEDDGETFQFDINNNATPVDADENGLNDGDVNFNGVLDVGETWTYTVKHVLTQDEIDNGGIVDPSLALNNTGTVTTNQGVSSSDSVSVHVDQNPHVAMTKTATVPGGTADTVGEVISYAISVTNDGNMTLTHPVVSDPSVSNLAGVDANNDGFNDGDLNHDGKLGVGETWSYTASHTVTQADIDNGGVVNPNLVIANTASVATDQGAGASASASVDVDQNPHVAMTKTATVPGGTADTVGEVISYAIGVSNDGNMTLTSPVVSDPSVSNLAGVDANNDGFNDGDANHDGKLGVGETWSYTASHTVTQADIDNGGVVDPNLVIANTASVTTGQGASASASASVDVDQNPHVVMTKAATVPGGTADTVGEVISYAISVTNDGNMTLTNATVTDSSASNLAAVDANADGFNDGDANHDGKLSVGETWSYTADHTVTQAELQAGGTINNTASVATDQGASASASASVTVVQAVTPNPGLTFVKTALGYHDQNGNHVADAGDIIDYSFYLENTGNVALHTLGLSDPDGVVNPSPVAVIAEFAVGAVDSTTYTATHVINSADVTAGYFENTAVAASEEISVPSTSHVLLSGLTLLV